VPIDPKRTVADLEELRKLTEDENGAQRVAWTETWERAREWLRGLVAETGASERLLVHARFVHPHDADGFAHDQQV